MGALLDQFTLAGVQIEASDGKLRAHGSLTDEFRATIREHKAAILDELAANDAGGLPDNDTRAGAHAMSDDAAPVDPDAERRRNRALAILAEEPERHIAVVAEAGNPAHVTVAIRGVAVGDLQIPAERYEGFALLALMQQYGHA